MRSQEHSGFGERPPGIFAKDNFDGHGEIVARRRCEYSIPNTILRHRTSPGGAQVRGKNEGTPYRLRDATEDDREFLCDSSALRRALDGASKFSAIPRRRTTHL
jgi:hypothetical protein